MPQSQIQPESQIDNSETFGSISEYRRYLMGCAAYSYSQNSHIFAPSPLRDEEGAKARSRLDGYMRQLYLMPLGAAMLQVEVRGAREIDLAFSSGEVYQRGGIHATLVQTETFSYYSTDPEAVGKREWLPFFLEETYVDRKGQERPKQNTKALKLAYQKPYEADVVNEVHGRFERWLNPVPDLFRRHWEVRETIEGEMVKALYFEYADQMRLAWEQFPGDENAEARHGRITRLRVQLLRDIEEVRETAPDRNYTDRGIIEAARRAIHNFCVDQNRKLKELLGGKRFVKMFLEGASEPQYVYRLNRNPENWYSPMLSERELVEVLQRGCLMLVESDQRRSKWRMDQKASETYAPVSHAETLKARGQTQEEQIELEDEEPLESLPFGLSWGGEETEAEEPELQHLSLVDVVATQGQMKPEFQAADLKRLPYTTIALNGDKVQVVHRFSSLLEAADSLRATLNQVADEAAQSDLQQRGWLLHDPEAKLGAEGSTRLLRTLDAEFQTQIQHQGDRYWCEWTLVKLSVSVHEQGQPEIMQAVMRYPSPAQAALTLKSELEKLKSGNKPEEFRRLAPNLKLVHDPLGMVGATGTHRPRAGLPKDLEAQLAATHYRVSRGQVILQVAHLKPEAGAMIADAITDQIIDKRRQAQAVQATAD